MGQPPNIDIFDRCVGIFFAKLYENFPTRIDIRFADVPENLFDETDCRGQVERKVECYEHAVKWLCDAGYAWAHHVDDRGAEGIVLSSKGLEVLRAKPRSLRSGKPIGELIVKAVKGGAKDALQEAVGFALIKGVEIAAGKI
jgi:hypothetical protein